MSASFTSPLEGRSSVDPFQTVISLWLGRAVCPAPAQYLHLEFFRNQAMSEGFRPVDHDHRNVVAIPREKFGITLDVYLCERVKVAATCPAHYLFCFYTKMAVRF